ncbi:MAG: hypothetical protein IPI79_10960 [Moraxellaceae bacterium]|nr:hypothetical protein [Moraxellaceae bacterium]
MKQQQSPKIRAWLVGIVCTVGMQSVWASAVAVDFSDLVEKRTCSG